MQQLLILMHRCVSQLSADVVLPTVQSHSTLQTEIGLTYTKTTQQTVSLSPTQTMPNNNTTYPADILSVLVAAALPLSIALLLVMVLLVTTVFVVIFAVKIRSKKRFYNFLSF